MIVILPVSFKDNHLVKQREALPRKRGMMFQQSKAKRKSVYMFNCLADNGHSENILNDRDVFDEKNFFFLNLC